MAIEILNCKGEVLHASPKVTVAEAVEEAVRGRVNLSRADLSGMDLFKVNLSWANLSEADLTEANLIKSNFAHADLSWANLSKVDLFKAELFSADLSRAWLFAACLHGANLTRAKICEADLTQTDLTRTNLTKADLTKANISQADVSETNLSGTILSETRLTGANFYKAIFSSENENLAETIKFRTSPFYGLLFQPSNVPIVAYKLVKANGEGAFRGGVIYTPGEVVGIEDANTDEMDQWGAGINVATLDWCLWKWQPGYQILPIQHAQADIAAIPIGSEGNYRIYQGLVLNPLDLAELGLEFRS